MEVNNKLINISTTVEIGLQLVPGLDLEEPLDLSTSCQPAAGPLSGGMIVLSMTTECKRKSYKHRILESKILDEQKL